MFLGMIIAPLLFISAGMTVEEASLVNLSIVLLPFTDASKGLGFWAAVETNELRVSGAACN